MSRIDTEETKSGILKYINTENSNYTQWTYMTGLESLA